MTHKSIIMCIREGVIYESIQQKRQNPVRSNEYFNGSYAGPSCLNGIAVSLCRTAGTGKP